MVGRKGGETSALKTISGMECPLFSASPAERRWKGPISGSKVPYQSRKVKNLRTSNAH